MSVISSVKNYLVGSYQEAKKVTWPTKQQTINYSILVIALSVGLALWFAALDYIFNLGLEQIITK